MATIRVCALAGLAALAAVLTTSPAGAAGITIINTVTANGYTFINFDGPTPNTGGTTIDGISNNGTVVGFTTDAAGNLTNFTANPPGTSATTLNINGSTTAMANGINSAGTVVGFDGTNNAFSLPNGGSATPLIASANTPAMAFGINDKGMIVGQYTTGANTPGFLLNGGTLTTINQPTGVTSDVINAQGINNNGLIVGFDLGNDGNVHGFTANAGSASGGSITGTAVTDPTISSNPNQTPGLTFVFSQILGVNDGGLAVGYYQDSNGNQHGYLYNTGTGKYTFLDDPSVGASNNVQITQITGINNAGEIAGFYSDANGVTHGFVAFAAVPEPGSVVLLGLGAAIGLGYAGRRARRTAVK